MATSLTTSVYVNVIEDVVNKVRDEFGRNNEDIDETVLNELQGLWEMKMMQCRAICGPIERSTLPKPVAPTGGGNLVPPVHDLNVPYEATDEYQTPTADMLFPPTPLQTPSIQTPLPGTTPLPGIAEHSMYHLPTPNNDYTTTTGHDNRSFNDVKPGRPSPYMQAPSPWMNQMPPLGVDVNVAYVEGRDEQSSHQPMTQDFFMMSSGKRKRDDFAPHFNGGGYIPQQDGAGDATFDVFQTEVAPGHGDGYTPQQEGATNATFDVFQPELYPYQGVASEDYNTVNTPAPPDLHAGTPNVGTQNEVGEDDDEPPLNENDDDDVDELDEEDEPNTQHLVLAQFDKVTRTKSRWKCTLKDGIMHINDKDILFAKATGEFDF